MEINPNEIIKKERYKLLSGSILPRPIAFVSTISKAGVPNLAPFSFFSGVTADPPSICFAPARNTDGSKKHTLLNIEETGEFIVHVVTPEILKSMHKSAEGFPADVNEFSEVGLTEVPAKSVKVPRVNEAKVCLECKSLKIVEVGQTGFLVIGEVVHFYFSDDVWDNGKINVQNLQPIGRMAGYDYMKNGELFRL